MLVALLVVTTVLALPHGHVANLHPFAPNGYGAIFPAAAVLVWGFAGWEAVTSLAADFRRPDRDLRRATAIAILVVGVLYLAIATTSILVLGPGGRVTIRRRCRICSRIAVGGPVKKITALIALLLTIGAMNAYFAGASKLGAALGRDGALPSWFAKGSEVGEVPRRSLSVIAALSAVALAIVAFGNVGIASGRAAHHRLVRAGLHPRHGGRDQAAPPPYLGSVGRDRRIRIVDRPGGHHRLYVLWALVVAGAALLYNRRRARLRDRRRSGTGRCDRSVDERQRSESGPRRISAVVTHASVTTSRNGARISTATAATARPPARASMTTCLPMVNVWITISAASSATGINRPPSASAGCPGAASAPTGRQI